MCLAILFISWPQAWAETPIIRVRILKSLSQVMVSGVDLSRRLHHNGSLKTHFGEKSIRFDCDRFVKTVRRKKPILLASVTSPTGFVTVNNMRYRGSLLLSTSSEGGGGCDVINKTTMEYYIGGLLAKEMNASWHLEALKSQAVAARTYAFYMMRSKAAQRQKGFKVFYDLESSERHQVGGSWDDITRRTDRASRETGGYVLEGPGARLSPIFYHAKCGGHTFLPEQVWKYNVAGYNRVVCGGCHNKGGSTRWKDRIGKKNWQGFLAWLWKKKIFRSKRPSLSETIRVADDSYSRHSLRVYVGEQVFSIKKSLLRRYFGRNEIPSNYFQAAWDEKRKHLVLSGDGHGHGVGLCQVGALGWANKGWKFEQILNHYFPSHRLVKIY